MKKLSYFLDSNVIVSGIAWDGNERKLLELGMAQEIELVTSSYALSEIERTLSKFGYSPAMIIDELLHLRAFIRIVDPTEEEIREHWNLVRDKSDVPILASIMRSGSELVTHDQMLGDSVAGFVRLEALEDIVERY